jgi:PAS domain S-box-containing protein
VLTLKQSLSYLLLGQKGGLNRIQIIEALKEKPFNINQLADHLGLNYRTVKHHIDILLKHEVVISSNSNSSVEVYFLSNKMEKNMEHFENIKMKLIDFTFPIKFLQNVLKQTNDAVVMVNNKNKIVYWNDGAEKIFGYNEMNVLGNKMNIFKNPDFFSDCLNKLEMGEDVIDVETLAEHKSGDIIDLSITVDAIKDDEDGIIGHSIIARDITERKRAQKEIVKAKERLEQVLSMSASAIFTERTSDDYAATFISENIAQLVGYDSSQFINNPGFWLEHVHPDDKEKVLAEIPNIIEKGYHAYEYRFRHKDGRYVWLKDEMKCIKDDNGNPLEIVGFCSDITEFKNISHQENE